MDRLEQVVLRTACRCRAEATVREGTHYLMIPLREKGRKRTFEDSKERDFMNRRILVEVLD